jgi:hypothetical protein
MQAVEKTRARRGRKVRAARQWPAGSPRCKTRRADSKTGWWEQPLDRADSPEAESRETKSRAATTNIPPSMSGKSDVTGRVKRKAPPTRSATQRRIRPMRASSEKTEREVRWLRASSEKTSGNTHYGRSEIKDLTTRNAYCH